MAVDRSGNLSLKYISYYVYKFLSLGQPTAGQPARRCLA